MNKNKKLIGLLVLAILGLCVYLFVGLSEKNYKYFIDLRGKKLIAMVLVGYAIAHSSTVFQTITNNNILTPSVIGLDNLYLLIQTLIVFFFQENAIQKISGNINFIMSLVLMLIFSFVIYQLLFKGQNKNIYFLILAGMIMGHLFSGLSSFMQVLLDPNEFLLVQGQMFASFNKINTDLLNISILIIIACFIVTIKDYPKLDVLSLGVSQAVSLGVDYKKLVKKSLMIVSILTATSTVLVGPITFLGILIVSISRSISGTYKHTYRIFNAFLISIIFLVYGSYIVERVFDFGTTLSVIINFFGGIYFLYFMLKEKDR